jgi:glycosyltransferase involved in cell wall biosynthesis
MKIAYTHPFAWPTVRRGNERNIDVMSRYFASQGHEVTSIASRPGARVVERDEGVTRILARPVKLPGMSLLRIDTTHTFFLTAWRELQRLDLDVVHSLLFTDALAASMLAPRRGFATVFQMNGVAIPGYSCRRFPPEAAMYRRVMRSADALVTCSEFIRRLVLEHYGADSIVIPPMVDVEAFDTGMTYPVERPNLLAAGDFTVARKGIRVLLEAFPLVKREIPDLVLNLSGRMPEQQITETIEAMPDNVRRDVRILGLGKPEDLPRLYAEASALVLPSMGEPSGTVLMEAWSAGTPIVTTNHGGVPEFVTEETGVLFEPLTDAAETRNAQGLARAIVEVLQLARQPGTATACRDHARRFSAARIGERIEALYRQIG